MTTKENIDKFKNYMINRRHGDRIEQQRTDQTFYEDTYELPLIKDKDYQLRTGYVSSMINGFTQQLIADVPRVYVEARKSRKQNKVLAGAEGGADRVASKSNDWMNSLARHPQNPIQETFKKKNIRGESWIYIVHNEMLAKWANKTPWQDLFPDIIPVHFILYDPMVVFADPSEEVDGRPKRVIVSYKRTAGDIRAHYPKWSTDKDDEADVDFLLYFDESISYAEADDKSLFTPEMRKNPYGFVPFVHAYSGWGEETQDMNPALLSMSRIRMIRDKIKEDSTLASDFCYNIHRSAHRHKTLFVPAGAEVPEDIFSEYKDAPDALSIMRMPEASTPENWKVEESTLFEPGVFAYRDRIKADMNLEYPLPLRGTATGSSGRQEDILSGHGLALYNCAINNTNKEWAQALDMAFKIINKIPNLLPPNLKADDLESYSEIKVDIRREDEAALSRKVAAGQMLWERGLISHRTFLIDHCNKTKEEAEEEIAQTWVDNVMRNSPEVAQIILQTIAREMDAEDKLAMLQETQGATEALNPIKRYGSKGGSPRTGNIKSPLGKEMAGEASTHEPRLPGG